MLLLFPVLAFHLILISSYTINYAPYETQKVFIQGTVSGFASSSNSSLFVAGTKQGLLYIYTSSPYARYSLRSTVDIGSSINVLALNNTSLALGLHNGTVLLYQLSSSPPQLIQSFNDTVYSTLSLEFSEDAKTLFTGSADSTIRIYKTTPNTSAMKLFQSIKNSYNAICAIKSLQNGRTVITGSYDRMVRVYSAQGQQTKYTLTQTVEEAENYVCAVDAWNDTVVIGSADFSVRVYRYSGKKNILFNKQRIENCTDGIMSVRFVNEDVFMSGGDDGIVRVYQKKEDGFVYRESMEDIGFPIGYIGYNVELKQIEVVSIDGILRRYLSCPKLTCQNKCYLYSQCPTCYHSQYFQKHQFSKYCSVIGQKEYQLQKYQLEYESAWYQNWYFWGALTLIKVIMTFVMRKRIINHFNQIINLFRRGNQAPTEVVAGTTDTLPNHIQLPVELNSSHSI